MRGQSAWRAETHTKNGVVPSYDKRDSHTTPAIFWPCVKEARIPTAVKNGALPSNEVFELRNECRDFNERLRAELHLRFSDVERRLDLLDLTGWLQEQLQARFCETDKKLDSLTSQISRCEASISAVHQYLRAEHSRSKAPMVAHRSESATEVSTGDDWATGSLKRESYSDHPDSARRRSMESLRINSALFRNRSPCVEGISAFLDDPNSGCMARWYARVWPPFVVLTAMASLVQTFGQTLWQDVPAAVCDVVFDVIFCLDLLLRYITCPNTWAFIKSPHNIIDFAAAAPLVLRVAMGIVPPPDGTVRFLLLCVVPLLRLLKMLRWMKQLHLFARVLEDTREALNFLLFMLLIIVLVFSSLIYLVEPRSSVESLPAAMWLTIVTVMTVGVETPETEAGYCLKTALLMTSVLYMSMPIGILGNAFTQVWKDRDLILLASRTSDRLAQRGFTAKDIPWLFRIFDREGKGELSVGEFRNMISELRVGLTEQRTVELFDMLDRDGGGSIDCKEFLKVLFPSTYYELHGSKRAKRVRKKPVKEDREHTLAHESTVAKLPTHLPSVLSAGPQVPCAPPAAEREGMLVFSEGHPGVEELGG
mmetsp:Transcript_87906/g.243903  ORF Transcript_87906/g.243903 Transcript_87906/m.243903 type:complete len:594 (+) Transcript_87906:108-1889(+)